MPKADKSLNNSFETHVEIDDIGHELLILLLFNVYIYLAITIEVISFFSLLLVLVSIKCCV